jgi:hypothetical protein
MTSKTRADEILIFDPAHFLEESISEFLESGVDRRKLASCVVKIATSVELLLKDRLEAICPALILEKIDPDGLQVVKLYGIEDKLLKPGAMQSVELHTANFATLIKRAAHFIDLSGEKDRLVELQKVRNGLVHHRGRIELWAVNLLLIRHIFPFLQRITKDNKSLRFRITEEDWKRLREIEKSSFDVFSTQLSKKIAHFASIASRISDVKKKSLAASKTRFRNLNAENLFCPACKYRSADAIIDIEVDYDRDGTIEGAAQFISVKCRLCGLSLSEDEAAYIGDNPDDFFGTAEDAEGWRSAVEIPEEDYSDIYP